MTRRAFDERVPRRAQGLAVTAALSVLAALVGLAQPAAADAVPTAAKSVTATSGNAQALVKWQAPTANGAVLTAYLVTPLVGGAALTAQSFPASALSGTVTGLANGTTYTFTVTAVSALGSAPPSTPSAPLLVGTPAPPGSPTVAPGNGQATLKWTAPVDNGSPVTGYSVTPYLGSTPLPAVVVGSSTSTATVTGLANGTSYSFRVSALNAIGASPTSNLAAILIGTPGAPGAVTGVGASHTATLSWPAGPDNGSPITGYLVTPLLGSTILATRSFPTDATSVTLTGLDDGRYTFRVVAQNIVGAGPSTVSGSVLVGPPPAPVAPTVTSGNGQATIRFTAPASVGSPITGYVVTPYAAGVAQTPVTVGTATTQTITGLTNGTSYTFTVAAVNAGGTGPDSPPSAPVLLGTPAAPGGLTATAGDGLATLKWTAPVTNGLPVTGYEVTPYLGTVAQPKITFASTATTQTITGLTNGGSYRFTVAATVTGGSGAVSGLSTAVLVGSAQAPVSVTAIGGDQQATVTWVPPAGPLPVIAAVVTPYVGSVAKPAQTFGGDAPAVVTGLANGTIYTFKVSLVNAIGPSPAVASGSTLVGPAGAPTGVSALSGNGRAYLKWTAPASVGSPITSYIATPFVDGVAQAPVTIGTVTPQTVLGLPNGVTYTFTVAAVNGAGAGPPSAVTNPVLVGAPAAPSGVTATAGNGVATVRWTAPATNGSVITGYVVTPYLAGVAQAPRTFASTAVTQVIDGLANGGSWTFTVTAAISGGLGPASSRSTAVIVGAPAAPGNLLATTGDARATLTWVAPVDNGSPIVGYAITPVAGTTVLPTQTVLSNATTAVVGNLQNGTTYTFRVAALNALGTGPTSTSAAVVIGVPAPPTAVIGEIGPLPGQVTLRWTTGSNNGSAITGWVVTPFLNGIAQPARPVATTATTTVVSPLDQGKTYTFKVSAVNAKGTSALSAASPAIVAPVEIPVATRPISAGRNHTCATSADGAVLCWGVGGDGQLGNGTSTDTATPRPVTGVTGAQAVAAGDFHSCALVTGGTVKCWGDGSRGQLGDGIATSSNTPVAVVGISSAAAVVTGANHSCALVLGGLVKCWGSNVDGQLGNGNRIDASAPVTVSGISGATAISAGWEHTCAVVAAGAVKCWGYNSNGQLGNGNTSLAITPVSVTGLTGATAVSAGGFHTCALVATGGLRCWGANSYGQLGTGTTVASKVPVDTGITGGAALDLGLFHSCLRMADGTASCWGDNYQGQLGNGANVQATRPTTVKNLAGVTTIDAGSSHTCAVLADGSARCWGFNGFGQLGRGAVSIDVVSYDVANSCEGSVACNGGAGQVDLAAAIGSGPKADVYAVQESCTSHTEVATALGAGYRSVALDELGPAEGGACGSASTSLTTALHVRVGSDTSMWGEVVRSYTATDAPYRRGFACAHTQVQDAPVLACSTDLAADPAIAAAQSTELLNWITVNRVYWESVIVAGDFGLAPGDGGGAWSKAWRDAGFTSANSGHLATRADGLEVDHIWVASAKTSVATTSLGQHSNHLALRATVAPPLLATALPVPVALPT